MTTSKLETKTRPKARQQQEQVRHDGKTMLGDMGQKGREGNRNGGEAAKTEEAMYPALT